MVTELDPFVAQTKAWQKPAGLNAVVSRWRADAKEARNIVLWRELPPAVAVSSDFPAAIDSGVRRSLIKRGIHNLFSHQARAFALASAGQSFVIATPTASGKSLCYNLPILNVLAEDASARALYLFPTKALSRDQEEALRALMHDAGLTPPVVTYDGDTPGDARRAARQKSCAILTNPDMLHTGILPHHAAWAHFFANLKYVVLDELHVYRGVFGSHLANVLRRLQRIAEFYGSRPTFIFASATIGNPREHAERMLGRAVEFIGESGAPSGPRQVLVYNPPVVNAELGIRASYIKTAVRLTADLVEAGVPTLVFGQSRNGVEVMLKYLRDRFADPASGVPAQSIQAYRGGYLADTRRRIEAGLRDGSVRCVVATNALELGIDIGSLDAVVCAGYPGSVAALWQRFGRAGRRKEGSAALLITSSAPTDQYFATLPNKLLDAPIEHARIDPDNVEILIQHLKCAAFELPFRRGENFGDVPDSHVAEALEFLCRHQVLHAVEDGAATIYHWSSDTYPANGVSLRSVGWDNTAIIDCENERVIAEMDFRASHTMLHPQAIYQHEGVQYQVEKLDLANHKAFVRKVAPDYYTDAMSHVAISVMEKQEQKVIALKAHSPIALCLGEVSVVEKVVGFKKIKFHSHENVGYGEVNLPEMQMHTTAAWLHFAPEVLQRVPVLRPVMLDALRGLTNVLHTVAAVGLMIDPRDLGRSLQSRPGAVAATQLGEDFSVRLFVFDRIPGGVGLAPRVYEQGEEWLWQARRLLDACVCSDGCPTCMGAAVKNDSPLLPGQEHTREGRKALLLSLLSGFGIIAEV